MRHRRALAAVLAVLAAVAGALALVAGPAPRTASAAMRAADDTGPVQLVVSELAPLVATADADLVLSGTVRNTSPDPLTSVTVQLRVSHQPLAGRSELAELAASTERPPGTVLDDYVLPVADVLAAGASAPWRLAVPGDRLGLTAYGVYPIAVECRAGLPSGERDRVATARTFLPWMDDATRVQPTRVAVLWPVLATPTRGAEPPAGNDAGAAAARAELLGRLDRVVRAGTGGTLTWVVDGDQLESAAELADGTAGGGGTAGTAPDPEAQAWLTRLSDAVRGGDVNAVGYADPDAAALTRARLGRDLSTATSLGPAVAGEIVGRPVGADLAWPDGGSLDPAGLAAVAQTGARAVVLSDRYAPPEDDLTYTPDAVGSLAGTDLTAVVSDATLSALLSTPVTAQGGPVLARQRFLSEVAAVTAERPSDGRSVVVAPTRYLDPDPGYVQGLMAALGSVPWATPATVAALRADPGEGPARRAPSYPATLRAREVPQAQLARARVGRLNLSQLEAVLTRPQPLVDVYERALLRCGSSAWRTRTTQGAAFTTSVTGVIAEARGSVTIVSPGQITLAARSGLIPITVANDLSQPVTVRVGVTAIPSVRLAVTQPEPVTVAPGRRVSVEVPAEAAAVGQVVVEARLLTPDGAPYGPAVTIPVRVTGFGQVAGLVVAGALALLAVALVLRVVRAIRRGPRTDRRGPRTSGPTESVAPADDHEEARP